MDFKVQLAQDVGQTVADALRKAGAAAIMEPKYDGWRCIAIRREDRVDIYNRSQKCYTGQLPELEADLMKLPVGTILDGELVKLRFDGERWENRFFDIHTAMRSKDVSKLARTREGIKLIAFDVLANGGDDACVKAPLGHRRQIIASLIEDHKLRLVELTLQLSATQEDHDALVALGFEGSVVKDPTRAYAFGKRGHGWYKIKDVRTIDTVVMDVLMDGKGQHAGKAGRMVVGQIRDGKLVEVAKVNCLNNAQRDDATRDPGSYIGRVLEVKIYGWDTEGPRHPTPLRFREDKPASECVWSKV